MIKNRSHLPSIKTANTISRPATAILKKSLKNSSQIGQIIHSLQKNVKELRLHYFSRQQPSKHILSQGVKHRGSLKIKRTLVRNESQKRLAGVNSKVEDKGSDVMEVKKSFFKSFGRQSNNIVELYEHFKKNIEKRQKSTRILASMQMSNNMGFSSQLAKESLQRQDNVSNHNLKESIKQEYLQKNEQQIKDKRVTKTSKLAEDLLSRGCFNLTNVASLLNGRKYKLYQDSEKNQIIAKTAEMLSNNLNPNKENQCHNNQASPQNNRKLSNSGNNFSNNLNEISSKTSNMDQGNSRNQISFKKLRKQVQKLYEESSEKKIMLSSAKKQKSKSIKKFMAINQPIETNEFETEKQMEGLTQSPILGNKISNFESSKYYVKPVPQKSLNEQSISLRSSSRIIDLDMLPFDL